MPEIPNPPPLAHFKEMVANAALVDSLRGIRRSAFIHAARNAAWIPHLEFIEEFMRQRGIGF